VKSILVSQPEPKAESSPYAQIIENHKVKVALLHRKTYAFAMPKRSYHFLTILSLQNQPCFGVFFLSIKEKTSSLKTSNVFLNTTRTNHKHLLDASI
ncbi:MAG: hypothetical protein ACFNQD_05920, partial [Prevotella intermedia]